MRGLRQEAEERPHAAGSLQIILTLSFRKERVARNEPDEVLLISQVKLRQVFRRL